MLCVLESLRLECDAVDIKSIKPYLEKEILEAGNGGTEASAEGHLEISR